MSENSHGDIPVEISSIPELEEIILCDCHYCEHQIIVESDDGQVFLMVHLCRQSIWRRLKYAIKYIFGYRCKYGAFEEIILSSKDFAKVESIADYLSQHLIRERIYEQNKK